jgi:hypothetical protein
MNVLARSRCEQSPFPCDFTQEQASKIKSSEEAKVEIRRQQPAR